MSDTRILWSYPFVFRRVKRVDAKYAYLVVKDGYIPLRRREGCLRKFLPYVVYTYFLVRLKLETIDEISSFFQTQMEDEYLLEEEYDVSDYGKLWDKEFDELYGMRKHVEETCNNKTKLEKEFVFRELLENLYNKS